MITWSTRYIKVVDLRWKDRSFRVFLKVSRSNYYKKAGLAHGLRDLLVKLVKKQLNKVCSKVKEEWLV